MFCSNSNCSPSRKDGRLLLSFWPFRSPSQPGSRTEEFQIDFKHSAQEKRSTGARRVRRGLGGSLGDYTRSLQGYTLEESPSKAQSHWKSAKDAVSGKCYYYHKLTRETQWEKPADLATGAERMEILRRLQEQKEFFQEMESNVYDTLSKGQLPGDGAFEPVGVQDIETRELSWKVGNKAHSTHSRSIASVSTCTESDSDQSIDSPPPRGGSRHSRFVSF